VPAADAPFPILAAGPPFTYEFIEVNEHESRPTATTHCWRCDAEIATSDHYCRNCGNGQGATLQWYYRPLWIALLAMLALGPFALPLVWRTPALGRGGRWALTAFVLAFTALVVYRLWVAVEVLRSLVLG
jgi:hypothetical protein